MNLERMPSTPPVAVLDADEEIETKTRAVLTLLLTVTRTPLEPSMAATSPLLCPNCGRACDDLKSPYCGESCKEEAAFVRQMRAALQSGALVDEERQAALGQKLWRVLGGGLPRRLSIAPARNIRQALERADYSCQICGAPASTVDHPGSG
jgi:hypothetical protein